MIDIKTCGWLMDNADAPIRYRVLRELIKDGQAAKDIKVELLKNATVKLWLKNLKPETPPQHWSMEHGSFDFCFENALLKTVQLGLHCELPQMLNSVQYYLVKMKTASFEGGYRANTGFRFSSANLGFYSILITNFLTLADLKNEIVQKCMLGSLDELNNFVSKCDYDIYVSDEERNKLKAVPAIWKNRTFINRNLVEEFGLCYPLIYDIIGLHKLYGTLNSETDKKIDAVIKYISTDEFHNKIFDGYGILIFGDRKYYSMGWDPKYPGWHDVAGYMENDNAAKLLFFAQFISKYPIARKTKWYYELNNYIEKYKTVSGTYIFPAEWLKEKKGYAVQGNHISFGETRRKKNWREIESTFYVQLLRQYIE